MNKFYTLDNLFFKSAKYYNKLIEDSAYTEWSQTETRLNMDACVYEAYIDFLVSNNRIISGFYFIKQVSSNGFFISSSNQNSIIATNFTSQDFLFWQLFIVSKLKSVGYIINLGELTKVQEGEMTKDINVFYLKPSIKWSISEDQFDQLYGNIRIVLTLQNQKFHSFRFIVHTYNGRSYKKAFDYESLMALLFKN